MSERESRKNRTRTQVRLGSKLERKLWGYAGAAAAAGLGMLASPQAAEGKVVYTETNEKIAPSIAIDLNGDGVVDFNLTSLGWATSSGGANYLAVCHDEFFKNFSHQCISSSYAPNAANLVRVAPGGAAALAAGAKIGPGPQWGGQSKLVAMGGLQVIGDTSQAKRIWFGQWANGGKGVSNRYLGFKFKIGSEYHYGWARVTATADQFGIVGVLTGYAYETVPGKAILAGATTGAEEVGAVAPESKPTATSQASLGMLSLGAAGLSIWRGESPDWM